MGYENMSDSPISQFLPEYPSLQMHSPGMLQNPPTVAMVIKHRV